MVSDIVTAGRIDVDDYFRLSGIRAHKKLNHTPLLVFERIDESVRVKIVDRADKLLEYPDDVKVMGQWQGQWSSDFFQFTVGQFRAHVDANPKDSYQVV